MFFLVDAGANPPTQILEFTSLFVGTKVGLDRQDNAIRDTIVRLREHRFLRDRPVVLCVEGAPGTSAIHIWQTLERQIKQDSQLHSLIFMCECKIPGREERSPGVPKTVGMDREYMRVLTSLMKQRAVKRWRHMKFFISDAPEQPLKDSLAMGLERLEVMMHDYRDKHTAAGGIVVTSKSATSNNDALSAMETGIFWGEYALREEKYRQTLARFPV